MISYIIVGLVTVLSPVIGFFMGAVRMVTCLVGVLVAALAAPMVAPMLEGLLPKIKITKPFWQDFFGPGIAFLLILLVFFGVSFAVHMIPSNWYRNRRDEVSRLKWVRLMQRSGVLVGVVTGFAFLLATGHLVNVFGYPTQLFSGSKGKGIQELNDTREGFETLGLRELSGNFDGTKDEFYQLVETVATIYSNPSPEVRYRLTAYPPFIGKLDSDSFYKSIASDSTLKGLFDNKGDFTEIYANQNVQEALENMPISDELKEIDLEDLQKFLVTGVSEKYSSNKVVGRWQLDAGQTSRSMLNEMNDISRSILPVVRKAFVDVQIQFVATLDGRFKSQITIPSAKIAKYLEEQAQGSSRDRKRISLPSGALNNNSDSSFQDNSQQFNQQFRDQYGGGPGAQGFGGNNQGFGNSEAFEQNQRQQQMILAQRARANKTAGPNPEEEIKKLVDQFAANSSGTWEKAGYKYILKFNNGKTLEAVYTDGDLQVVDGQKRFVFYPDL